MLNVSAIRINYRSWLRSSSTCEPSDPPLRIVLLVVSRPLSYRVEWLVTPAPEFIKPTSLGGGPGHTLCGRRVGYTQDGPG